MKNKIVYVLIGLVILFGMVFFLQNNNEKKVLVEKVKIASQKNATYVIDGQSVTLVDGLSSVLAAPGSASKITTQYFGNEVLHDFNKDGRLDVAFIITQNTGGSGTFYYVVVALNTENGYLGSNAILLGDRIAPQTTEISIDVSKPDVIIVNYADRKSGDSFTNPPSIGKSMLLKFNTETMQLSQVVQ